MRPAPLGYLRSMLWFPWALTAIALAAATAYALAIGTALVNLDMLFHVSVKVLRDRNLNRMRKLLVATGRSPVPMALRILVDENFAPTTNEAPAAVRIEVAAESETDAAERLTKSFDELLAAALRDVRRRHFAPIALFALLGAASSGYISASSAQTSVPTAMLIAWLSTGLALAYGEWKGHRVAVEGPLFFRRLRSELFARPLTADAAEGGAYRSPLTELVAAPEPASDELRVVVQTPDTPPRSLVLAGNIFKIGTQESAHIRIEGDEGVSRIHAVIERTDEGMTIIDLGSAAGTLFEGTKIQKRALRHGDSVTIGSTTLTFGIGSRPQLALARASDETIHAFAFDTRAPDLFFSIAEALARATPAAKGIRVLKLRRAGGSPAFLVALVGDPSAVKAARIALEEHAEDHYRRCATPVEEIAPDLTYGVSRNRQLRQEMTTGEAETLDTATI